MIVSTNSNVGAVTSSMLEGGMSHNAQQQHEQLFIMIKLAHKRSLIMTRGRAGTSCGNRQWKIKVATKIPETLQEGNDSGSSAQALLICQHYTLALYPLLPEPVDCLHALHKVNIKGKLCGQGCALMKAMLHRSLTTCRWWS